MRRAAPAVLALMSCRIEFDRVPISDATGTHDTNDASDAAPAICHSGTWAIPQRLAPPSTTSHESDPTLSLDQREIFYTSNAGATQGYGIWHATRAAATDPFMAGSLVAALDSVNDDFDPSLSADGTTILFTSGAVRRRAHAVLRTRRGRARVRVARRADRRLHVRPRARRGQRTTDSTPSITTDGLELFFESTRTGAVATYVARRNSPAEQFSAPVELTELVTSVAGATASGGPAISADGRTLYVFLNTGQIDLYVVTRSCD